MSISELLHNLLCVSDLFLCEAISEEAAIFALTKVKFLKRPLANQVRKHFIIDL